MDMKKHVWIGMGFAYWIICIAWTSPIFSIDLTGLWQLEGEELHRYEHQVWTDYEDGTVEERDFVGVVDQPHFEILGYATQFDGQIEATLVGKRLCNDLFEMTFVATISADNKVEFTNTYPGGSERCYQDGASWYFSWADEIGSYSGVYDPDKRVITGTFDCYQEWAYTECWENDPLFGYSHYSVESTNIITDGTFSITVRSVRFIDKEDYSREVFGATADGASEVVIEAGPLPPNVVDASQVIVTIPDDGGELLDDAMLHAGIFRQTWKAPEDFAGRVPNPELGKRKIDFQVYINGVDLEAPEFNLYKPPVVLIHGIWSDAGAFSTMENYLTSNYSPYGIYRFSYPNDQHFSNNIPYIGSGILNCINTMKDPDLRKSTLAGPDKPIVVKKADIVAHSMGGILSGLYVASATYRKDVNRLITLDTPHNGSEAANFLMHFIFEEMDETDRDALEIYPLYLLFKILMGSMTAGAVEDLQVGSDAMDNYRRAINTIDLPVYAICTRHSGNAPSTSLNLVYGGNYIQMGLWYWDRNLANRYPRQDLDGYYFDGLNFPHGHLPFGYSALKVEYGLFHEQSYVSDFIVSLESQRGGSSAYEQLELPDHISVTNNLRVKERVCKLLNSSVESFDENGFSPSPWYTPARVGPVSISPSVLLENQSGFETKHGEITFNQANGGLTIVSPMEGTTFLPGETVTVEVSYTVEPTEAVCFLSQDGSMGIDESPPYQFEFTIDQQFIGSMLIVAWAAEQDAPLWTGHKDAVEVSVVTTHAPVTINVLPPQPIHLAQLPQLVAK